MKQNRSLKVVTHHYSVETTFRVLDDEQVGAMQHLLLDGDLSIKDAAAMFHVSVATVYKVKKAIPNRFLLEDQAERRKWRRAAAKRLKRRSSV